MYRGVVRVFDKPMPASIADDPASPVEKKLMKAMLSLRNGMNEVDQPSGIRKKEASCQTDSCSIGGMAEIPPGYGVPKVFVRSVAEAMEQGVIAYCPLVVHPKDREKAMLRMVNEVAEYISSPKHLYFEIFESNPTWYDYVKISVVDCVTANCLGTADLVPPTTKVILANVRIPMFESPIVDESSVPHLAQVEISLLKFSSEDTNRVVAQSVTVPLELFVKAGTIQMILDEGEQRDISYRATLVRDELII